MQHKYNWEKERFHDDWSSNLVLTLDEDLTGDPLIIRLSCNDLHPCSIQWTELITIQLNVKDGLVGSPPIEETDVATTTKKI